MKILLLRTSPDIMDISRYNSQEIGLAKGFIRNGHQCDIIYYDNKPSHTEKIKLSTGDEITIFWLRGVGVLKNGFFFGLRHIIKNYDIIQVAEYDQILSWWLYSFSKKNISVYHGPYYCTYNRSYNLKCSIFDHTFLAMKKAKNTLIFTKSTLAEAMLRQKGFENVHTVGVGLDPDQMLQHTELVPQITEMVGNIVAYIGRLEPRRNIEFLFKVFAGIAMSERRATFLIIGKGEQKYINRCWTLAQELGITERIIYIESVKQQQLGSIYKRINLLLLPTRYEIFGMVLLEAMYFGVPVLTSDNGGAKTLIKHEYNGFVERIDLQNSIDNWVKQALMILNSDLTKLKENAQKTIKQAYTWEKIAEQMLIQYHQNYT